MSVGVRLVGFALAMVALFAAATVAGAELDPQVDEDAGDHAPEMEAMDGHDTASAALPGLASAQDGYRLVPERSELSPSDAARYRFRIVDADGQTVHDFDVEHERRMHLIVVRRDFAGFQHLHPRQRHDGSWVAEADLSESGVYRAFADFSTGGTALTLGTDVFVAGAFEPRPLPPVSAVDAAGDGYEVRIDSPAVASDATPVSFTVTRNGREIGAVEPYLGADGHLVALREHDQAYLHTHPEGEPGGAGPIEFDVEYPTPGDYRLFLQFRHRGEVRTAAFTQRIADAASGEEVGHGD